MAPSVEQTVRQYLAAARAQRRSTATPAQARALLVAAGIIKRAAKPRKKRAAARAG